MIFALTFQNHTNCPLTDFGGKTSIFSHPVYLFLRKFSLQDSRGGSVSVGEFCSKKVLGVCLEKKRSYCQFDSKLAQIVQQQGRNGQLRISFGSAKHPDCRGITVDELQKIQFNRLDFTNFYEDLMNNQKIPDSGVLTQKVKEQIADQLKQAGQ
ncbi:conjugal transfer protein TraN [Escherichia coli]|uniref:conjugal transfer protein TraN n=1 Tax=Escherichia coli TaxID=562 RepID=UPI00256EDDA3|nr:conjugal transfer protein TraN [Escherichia coli]